MSRIGGSFAPRLSAEKLAAYRTLAATASPQVGEAMVKLCDMVGLFRQTPDSTLPGKPHPAGRGVIVPLEDAEIKRIWDAVPWAEENEMYGKIFDGIPAGTQKPLRDAAFHLLWYAIELAQDRQPITNDTI